MAKSKQQKQQEAVERQKAREERTDADQLVWLELRGHGNSKEAQRLKKRLNVSFSDYVAEKIGGGLD